MTKHDQFHKIAELDATRLRSEPAIDELGRTLRRRIDERRKKVGLERARHEMMERAVGAGLRNECVSREQGREGKWQAEGKKERMERAGVSEVRRNRPDDGKRVRAQCGQARARM
eukprot:6204377-Pleurochrysis_carterae.AAC.1